MFRTIALLAVLLLTVAAGMFQGRLTNRWGVTEDLHAVGRKLEELPASFGNWELVQTHELDDVSRRLLEPYGHVGGVYRNQTSGAHVTMFIIVGPPGLMAIHTPEICMGGRQYQQMQSRTLHALNNPASPDEPHTFWRLLFRLTDVEGHMAPTYYAWTLGDRWIAAEDPRFAFAGKQYLYKVQVTTRVPATLGRLETDPCEEFLAEFATAVEPYLVSRP